MKTYYPIQIFDLSFQFNYMTSKKIRHLRKNPLTTNLYVLIKNIEKLKRFKVELKWLELKFFDTTKPINDNNYFERFYEERDFKNWYHESFWIEKVNKYPINPTDSKSLKNTKGFIIIDNGQMVGTHWTCLFFHERWETIHLLGAAPDRYLLNQLTKPTIHHNYKI